MNKQSVRVRFAPAPTGMMHLGNIRTALINYLFARKKGGVFVLRIEDTDPERIIDPFGKHIVSNLKWLDLTYDEGPEVDGPYAPYFQSQRSTIYQKYLTALQKQNNIYRCFCTLEELDTKRNRQKALKLPPRYDRTCLNMSEQSVFDRLDKKTPFIWRFKLDHAKTITINDLAHKTVTFSLANFSDFPLTRHNGSATFMFANCVDDITMNITHVFRGEDHLSNTAGQAALFEALEIPLPTFWHMPILCNKDGKKLSKRDFGFSLHDLQETGFLPESIVNYLGIIGGTFTQEVMSLALLIDQFEFNNLHTTGHITYDVEKLRWLNRKWISQYDPIQLTKACFPFLLAAYPHAATMAHQKLSQLLQAIKTDMITLNDSVDALHFYFNKPAVTSSDVHASVSQQHRTAIVAIITNHLSSIDDPTTFTSTIKRMAKKKDIPLKDFFWFLRLALTGKTKGPQIHELITMLGPQISKKRILEALPFLR